MKNILILTSYISGHGGMEKIINNIKKIITDDPECNNSYNIDVLSLSDGTYNNTGLKKILASRNLNWMGEYQIKQIKLKFNNRKLNSLFHLLYLIYFLNLKKEKYTHIISTGPGLCIILSKVRKILRGKFKIYAWPHFSSSSGNGDFSKFNYADKVLCISHGIKTELQLLGIDNSKLEYFPNPFFKFPKEYYEKFVTNGPVTKFVYIGRLLFLGQKRIKDILDAIMLTNRELEFHIIGDGQDYESINSYIKSNDLNNIVHIHKGWFESPWSVVKNISAFILASDYEGLPTVLGEALSRGIPCISSDCNTGPRDFIIDGENGFLYEPRDINELARLINIFINKEKEFKTDDIVRSMNKFYVDAFIDRWNKNFD